MKTRRSVRVWDPLVRICHWSLVISFAVAWWSRQTHYEWHLVAGYVALALVGVRLAWGIFGSRHARFAGFVHPPGRVLVYLKSLRGDSRQRYLGHNPAGGFMVLLLLLDLSIVTGSGIALDGAENWSGPLAEMGLFRHTALIESIHATSTDLMLALIGLHLAGVVFMSLKQRENLVRAMITGRKRASG